MKFWTEYLLAWHRAIWFPVNWMLGLEAPAEGVAELTIIYCQDCEKGMKHIHPWIMNGSQHF